MCHQATIGVLKIKFCVGVRPKNFHSFLCLFLVYPTVIFSLYPALISTSRADWRVPNGLMLNQATFAARVGTSIYNFIYFFNAAVGQNRQSITHIIVIKKIDADRPINFKNGQSHLAQVFNALLPQLHKELIVSNIFTV